MLGNPIIAIVVMVAADLSSALMMAFLFYIFGMNYTLALHLGTVIMLNITAAAGIIGWQSTAAKRRKDETGL